MQIWSCVAISSTRLLALQCSKMYCCKPFIYLVHQNTPFRVLFLIFGNGRRPPPPSMGRGTLFPTHHPLPTCYSSLLGPAAAYPRVPVRFTPMLSHTTLPRSSSPGKSYCPLLCNVTMSVRLFVSPCVQGAPEFEAKK